MTVREIDAAQVDRRPSSRRRFLQQTAFGMGTIALAHLLAEDGLLASPASESLDQQSRTGHHPGRARAMILLLQNGGPSQVDLFDPKPELARRDGQQHSETLEVLQPGNSNRLMGSPYRFRQYGECGMYFSELLPQMARICDEFGLVLSMHTENNNHPQALRALLTGQIFPGRPTIGAWISYGLGSDNQNLPAYVSLRDPKGYNSGGSLNWDSGWLPAIYRGTEFQSQGAPCSICILLWSYRRGAQRADLDLLARLNRAHRGRYPAESDLEARIKHYELAARMQLSAESTLDLSSETEDTRRMYGLDQPATADYGKRCLMARRLVEAGVRFIHVEAPARTPWDNHSNLKKGIEEIAGKVDRPSAALIRDLKQRGLLDSTIVLWTGEFGRLPTSQNGDGRDHNRHGFGSIVAGGGFKRAYVHGATDDFGYRAVENRVSCTDLMATILHQIGLDHEQLAYAHHGREETLTDPAVSNARVVRELLAGST